jgi:ferredoxin
MQLSDRMRPLVKKADRRAPSYTSGARRKKDFKIFDPGLSRVEAIKEAARCMACLSGAVVDPVKCIACLTCVRVCPFEIPKIDFDNKSFINMAECQACGLCITECPATAIGYSRGQAEDLLQATLAAAKSGSVEFVCVNGLDESEELPPSASIVLVNCVSGIGQNLLLLALLNGAESVTVTPGREHECKNKGGRGLVAGRVAKVKEALRALGIDPETVVYKE